MFYLLTTVSELGKALTRLEHLRQLQFAVSVDSARALQLTKQLLSQLSKSALESEAAGDLTLTKESSEEATVESRVAEDPTATEKLSGEATVESEVADLTATRKPFREATVKSEVADLTATRKSLTEDTAKSEVGVKEAETDKTRVKEEL